MLQLLALSTPKTQALVDQTLNSTIPWINHYPADKCCENNLLANFCDCVQSWTLLYIVVTICLLIG